MDEWFKKDKDIRSALRFFATLYQHLDKDTRSKLIETSLNGFVEKYVAWKKLIDRALSENDSERLSNIFNNCSNMSWIGGYVSNLKRLDQRQQQIAADSFGRFLGELMSSIENGIAPPKLKAILQNNTKFKKSFLKNSKKMNDDLIVIVNILKNLWNNFDFSFVSKRILRIRDKHFEEIDDLQKELLTSIAAILVA